MNNRKINNHYKKMKQWGNIAKHVFDKAEPAAKENCREAIKDFKKAKNRDNWRRCLYEAEGISYHLGLPTNPLDFCISHKANGFFGVNYIYTEIIQPLEK